jgi:ketosteroid isomerase-like protein
MTPKYTFFIIVFASIPFFCFGQKKSKYQHYEKFEFEKKQIAKMLDDYNNAAAKADFKTYFEMYTEDAIFIGTDATEYWNKKEFMEWAKPYFEQKKTWHFTSLQRHIYMSKNTKIAWFDELLDTQMKVCRGSGVVIKQNNQWKVQHYVLSTTIPNKEMNAVIKLKTAIEDSLIQKLSKP